MKSLSISTLLISLCLSALGQQQVIFSHDSSDWFQLQVRNADGNDINPSLTDPDFNQTWFQHTPPDFGIPPFETIAYDGPSFTSASTPIQYGDAVGFPEFNTELTPPTGGDGHTLWLLKAIDGGEIGFGDLELNVRVREDCFVYLNGKLIGQTHPEAPASDTWITHATSPPEAQPLTRTFSAAFGQTFYLNPGPNLLAVSVHSREDNLNTLGFSAELKGTQTPLPDVREIVENISEDRFRISYLTGITQPTLINYGTSRTQMTTQEISGERIFHHLELTDLKGSTTYFYEVLQSNGSSFSPPVTGHFTTPDSSFIAESSSGWQILHSLDGDGLGIDPTLGDPDFDTTWMTLGMEGSSYDGPAFVIDQTSPIRVSGGDTATTGTILANPGANRSGAIYLVKEIEGPLNGTLSLDFEITTLRAYRLYLNGELIIDNLGITQPGSSWGIYWQSRSRQPTSTPGFLFPGKNTLAISLHPSSESNLSLDFDMSLSGVAGTSSMIPLMDPIITDSTTTIRWFTPTPSASQLRYGTTRDDLANLITLPDSSTFHEVSIPNPNPGERVYYEILQANGDSFDPPSINSFISPKQTLISFKSDWYFLNPRDPDTDVSIDPATLDLDFYQTWLTQSIGSFPGNDIYDGPAFNGPSPAPFGPESSYPETNITQPAAVWFLKEVDGGENGYHQLELNSNGDTSVTVFLNGNRIGETYTAIASQAIWSQDKGRYYTGSNIPIPSNLVLPPGPNLIAVLMHMSHSEDNDVFDLSLSGTPLQETATEPYSLNTTSNTVELSWATSNPQPTRVRWGVSPSTLAESVEIPGERNYHTLSHTDLAPATTYFIEVLDGTGNSFTPPVFGNFRTLSSLIIGRESTGWSTLDSISDGAFTDPTLSDPDFLLSWHQPANYDGPAFTPNQSSPFVSQGNSIRVGQTIFPTIDSKVRPIWLYKEIDGGTTGLQSLSLDGFLTAGISAYLNGQLYFTFAMPQNANLGAWDQAATFNSFNSGNISLSFPAVFTIPPGPNLLAFALHPYDFEEGTGITAEFEFRGVPQRLTINQPSLSGITFNNISLGWTTSAPTTAIVKYGRDFASLDQIVESPELQTNHQIAFPEFIEGGTYTYEIIVTDALGETSHYVGTFQLFEQVMRLPFLQNAAPTSMTVKWRTRDPSQTLLRFGTDPNNLDQTISGTNEPAPLFFTQPSLNNLITDHTVTINGLSPATKYYYEIATDNSPAPASDLEQFFTTPPLPGTPAQTRIWVVGDSGQPGQGVLDVKDSYLQYTADTPTDLWLMLGDNAYESGTDSEYQRGLFDIFPEILKNTPVWPTMGNHDNYSGQYYDIFDLPTNGQSGGVPSGTEKYYSFDHGNIHFICLNSEENPPGMLDWLKDDLQSTRAGWIIAFFHHGPYTKGSHNSDFEIEHEVTRGSYLPILESYGVDLVLSGHSHQYERSHFLDGHYQTSNFYRVEDHAIDPGPGSPLGIADPQTGIFQYNDNFPPYQKTIASPNSGQVSAIIGASSKLSPWFTSTAQEDPFAITHPSPNPVHVATLRALGSMVIDVDGYTLRASYLDLNGQVRDHFEIHKSPDTGPAIAWWQDNFGPQSYPFLADWFQDSDNDQNNNLTEYVLGGDPLTKDQLSEASITTDGIIDGQPVEWFSFQYNLRQGTSATVRSSENLIDFTQSDIETRRLTEPDANGIARWEARVRRTDQRTLFFQVTIAR